MKTKIACLHAHHSNIEYINDAVNLPGTEWIHFVDPGLMARIAGDPGFDADAARNKVAQQVEWIASTGAFAILITCTNYIALLDEKMLQSAIPVVKVDEPLFEYVCGVDGPHVLLFSNPSTVDGTMRRLAEHAAANGGNITDVEPVIIDGTFQLLMQGNQEAYLEKLTDRIRQILASRPGVTVSVAQLSMVNAARRLEQETGVRIGHPLLTLGNKLEALLRTISPTRNSSAH
ncbi:hypothetical protein ACFSL6_06315 [Paenibacillus thailandensis]|uniref:Asp/Glu racemase n=1 Tax=Paenibacillus thailandensis TaxID=393250 RepID=A0ABW5QU92_9BACL